MTNPGEAFHWTQPGVKKERGIETAKRCKEVPEKYEPKNADEFGTFDRAMSKILAVPGAHVQKQIKKLPNLYAKLSAPLPPEALTPIPGTEFTAIKDAYVKERLNAVLGPEGWDVSAPKILSLEPLKDIEGHISTGAKGLPVWSATVSLTVTIKAFKKKYHGFGGNQNEDKGDALKGAATDAFGKAISDLVGIEVYKGLIDPQNLPQTAQYSASNAVGTATAKNGKYLWHSGVITEKLEGLEKIWFLCNGMLCYVEDKREVSKIAEAPICSKISFHATREYTKRSSVMKVVSVLEVRQFEKIQIPEMK